MVWLDPALLQLFDREHESSMRTHPVDALLRTVLAPFSLTEQQPPANVQAGPDGVRLHVLLPGYRAEELDISVEEDRVLLRGERRETAIDEQEPQVVASFERGFRLPFRPDGERVQAEMKNGVLELFLPRPESERPRRISVLES